MRAQLTAAQGAWWAGTRLLDREVVGVRQAVLVNGANAAGFATTWLLDPTSVIVARQHMFQAVEAARGHRGVQAAADASAR